MKLHVLPASPNSRKAMFVAAHSGLDVEIAPIDYAAGQMKADAFRAMNPNGKAPVLELDEGSLWESNAITNYLASRAESPLWPASMARYDIMKWQFWEASHFQPACSEFIGKYFFGDDSVDIPAATERFQTLAAVLDSALADRDWLVGEAMTTADVSVASYLCYRKTCHYPMDGYANIERWLGSIEAVPAWAEVNPAQAAAA